MSSAICFKEQQWELAAVLAMSGASVIVLSASAGFWSSSADGLRRLAFTWAGYRSSRPRPAARGHRPARGWRGADGYRADLRRQPHHHRPTLISVAQQPALYDASGKVVVDERQLHELRQRQGDQASLPAATRRRSMTRANATREIHNEPLKTGAAITLRWRGTQWSHSRDSATAMSER